MTTWEQFQTAYQNASPEVRAFIDSEEIPTRVTQTLTKRGLTVLSPRVTLLMTHLTLGTITQDEVIAGLVQLGIKDASVCISEIRNETKNNQNIAIEVPRSQELESTVRELEAEIAETEHTIESLPGLRTMASDMRAIHPQEEVVYRTAQADILQQVPPAAPTPTPDTPRWDTE